MSIVAVHHGYTINHLPNGSYLVIKGALSVPAKTYDEALGICEGHSGIRIGHSTYSRR